MIRSRSATLMKFLKPFNRPISSALYSVRFRMNIVDNRAITKEASAARIKAPWISGASTASPSATKRAAMGTKVKRQPAPVAIMELV